MFMMLLVEGIDTIGTTSDSMDTISDNIHHDIDHMDSYR